MKICIPVSKNEGLLSIPYGHFGSAPLFIVVDSDTKEVTPIKNGDLHHEHGKCHPLQALQNTPVDVVLVGGIGQGAIRKLNAMDIKVYQTTTGNVEDNMTLFLSGQLNELDSTHTCSHDGCGHH